LKGAWFWQTEWWWVIAINAVFERKLKEEPAGITVLMTTTEVNNMIDELGGSFRKRLRMIATAPPFVSLKAPDSFKFKDE